MNSMLVTGGAGFIGSNFVRFWRNRHADCRIVVLDALTYAGRQENLVGVADISFVHGDIRDAPLVQDLLGTYEVDTVVHFAAESHVDRSIAGAAPFISTNVEGTMRLLEAAKAAWLDRGTGRPHRFHHVSTDEVFGSLDPDQPSFTELSPYRPNSPYAASKAAADHLVRAYRQTYGLCATITHCSNNYGPRQHPEKLIARLITSALLGRAMPIYGDGLHIRDWLHVEDHCHGLEQALLQGTAGEIYNLGARTELTNIAVARLVCEAIDDFFRSDPAALHRFPETPAARSEPTAKLITHVEDRLGHDRRYAISAAKAAEEIGFAPTIAFREGLAETVAWYARHDDWWRTSA